MKLVGIQRTERDKKEERERWEQPMPTELAVGAEDETDAASIIYDNK